MIDDGARGNLARPARSGRDEEAWEELMTREQATDAIRLTLTVPAPVGRAYAVFAEGFASWYPSEYTWSRDVLDTIGIEGHEDGRCFERGPHGFWVDWGRVLVWDPPRRLVFTWQISPRREPVPDPGRASEVEVRFHEEGPRSTRVEFEHRGLSRHGEGAEGYLEALGSEQGWPYILDRYVAAVARPGMSEADGDPLQTFFARYGEALTAGDLPGIAGRYAVPGLVVSDAGSIPVATRAEVEAAFDGVADRYRVQGLVAARPTILRSEAISGRMVSVDVRWDYLDEQGHSAQQDGYRYVLRLEDDAGPQIQIVMPRQGVDVNGYNRSTDKGVPPIDR